MTMSFTYEDSLKDGIHRVIADWTSDGSGNASGTTTKLVGELIKGVTNPDDSAAPAADYDITVTDADGVNVLGSSADDLADRHTSNTECVYFNLTNGTTPIAAYPVVSGKLTIAVANAGDTKQGQLILYLKK